MTIKNRSIRAVRDWYRKHGEAGWVRDAGSVASGKCCPIIALFELGRERVEEHWPAKQALNSALGHPEWAGRVLPFGEWNDAPERTFAEVLAVVEAADVVLNGGAP